MAAKEKALAEGQQAAFRSLLKRLIPVTAFARAKQLASVEGADLVEGVRVRSERNSSTDYVASFDFTFQSKAVRDLLRREGIPFTDEQAPAVTIVPVWRAAAATPPRDEAGWTKAWKGLDLDNSLTPIKLSSSGKRSAPTPSMPSPAATAAPCVPWRASTAPSTCSWPSRARPAAGRLNVTLAGRDAVGAFALMRPYRVDAADPVYARELAAVVALRTLEGRWKAIKARGGCSPQQQPATRTCSISVEFRGMSEWQDISRKLGATQGVEELEVAGLSARGARVTLRYADGAEQLAQELARQGLNLRNAGGNWVLSLQ